MVCLGLEPGVAGWKAQTNPLSQLLQTSFIAQFISQKEDCSWS